MGTNTSSHWVDAVALPSKCAPGVADALFKVCVNFVAYNTLYLGGYNTTDVLHLRHVFRGISVYSVLSGSWFAYMLWYKIIAYSYMTCSFDCPHTIKCDVSHVTNIPNC